MNGLQVDLLCDFFILLCDFFILLCDFFILLCDFFILLCDFFILLCDFFILKQTGQSKLVELGSVPFPKATWYWVNVSCCLFFGWTSLYCHVGFEGQAVDIIPWW